MPEISDDAFKALQNTVREAAFRANRLLEWRELGLKVRVFERTFDTFWEGVRTANGNFDSATVSRLKSLWERCKFPDFSELQTYPDSIQHINKPLVSGNGAADDRVRKWIDTLSDKCNSIDTAFAGNNFGDLLTHCEDFRRTFQIQSSLRNNILEMELKQLCQLSNILAQRLEA